MQQTAKATKNGGPAVYVAPKEFTQHIIQNDTSTAYCIMNIKTALVQIHIIKYKRILCQQSEDYCHYKRLVQLYKV